MYLLTGERNARWVYRLSAYTVLFPLLGLCGCAGKAQLANTQVEKTTQSVNPPRLPLGNSGKPKLILLVDKPHGSSHVALSPDRSVVAAGRNIEVDLRSVATGQLIRRLSGHNGALTQVAFSPDGTKLASASFDGTIRLWDPHTGQLLHTLSFSPDEPSVTCVAFSPNSEVVAGGSSDGILKLWNAKTGDPLRTIQAHPQWLELSDLAFSPDGSMIATGCGRSVAFGDSLETKDAGELRVWNARTGELKWEKTGGKECFVYSLDFSHDGTLLITGGKRLLVWDAQNGELRATLGDTNEVAKRSVWDLSCFPNQLAAVVAASKRVGNDSVGELQLWDLAAGKLLWSVEQPSEDGPIGSVAISADGKLLATGNPVPQGPLRMWLVP